MSDSCSERLVWAKFNNSVPVHYLVLFHSCLAIWLIDPFATHFAIVVTHCPCFRSIFFSFSATWGMDFVKYLYYHSPLSFSNLCSCINSFSALFPFQSETLHCQVCVCLFSHLHFPSQLSPMLFPLDFGFPDQLLVVADWTNL